MQKLFYKKYTGYTEEVLWPEPMARIFSYKKVLSKIFFISFSLVVAVSAGLLVTSHSSTFTPPALAAGTVGLSGWAWSETIGWICFDDPTQCPNAGVTIDASNNLVGYAWSDNIGWIQFGGLAGFPTGGGTTAVNAKVQGSTIVGWAKALSAAGGWDGWISLSGTGYGPTISGSTMSGYAWGSDVVGWTDFSGVVFNATLPTCTLTNPGSTVAPGGNVTLTWTTQNSVSASINQSVGAVTPVAGGNKSVTVSNTPGTYTYTMTATNSTGSTATCATAVAVAVPPPPVSSINNFYALPARVRTGNASTLYWKITGLSGGNTCALTGSDGSNYPITVASSSQATNPISQTTNFTLSCTGGAASVTKTVTIVPIFREI